MSTHPTAGELSLLMEEILNEQSSLLHRGRDVPQRRVKQTGEECGQSVLLKECAPHGPGDLASEVAAEQA